MCALQLHLGAPAPFDLESHLDLLLSRLGGPQAPMINGDWGGD